MWWNPKCQRAPAGQEGFGLFAENIKETIEQSVTILRIRSTQIDVETRMSCNKIQYKNNLA